MIVYNSISPNYECGLLKCITTKKKQVSFRISPEMHGAALKKSDS